MIDSIWIADNFESNSFRKVDFDKIEKGRLNFGSLLARLENPKIKIVFDKKIAQYRNHDYTWRKLDRVYLSNKFCPKILRLEDGFYVQPNFNIGIWQIDPKKPSELLWYFNPKFSAPIVNYDRQNLKVISKANFENLDVKNLSLLFSERNAVEVSRSKIPFSAMACFTDHCDFDTLENLEIQREFFKRHKVKVTKGFFLNNFSKRVNASWENEHEEINKWINDGYEMAYHSLTQSLRKTDDAMAEFLNFQPPFKVETWIDHGFQPYNLSTFKKSAITDEIFESKIESAGIKNLWNYLDSGTSTVGVINQLNTDHFTLSAFLNGTQNFSFSKRAKLFFKLLLMHHFSDAFHQQLYKDTSSNFKKIRYQRQFGKAIPFISNMFAFAKIGLRMIVDWKTVKNKPFEHSKFAPVLFQHKILNDEFTIFQTLEMVDFSNSLNKQNIDLLMQESGLFIAHTYFSVPMEYHSGRMIVNGKINPAVEDNFKYLSQQIQSEKIWNATLAELGRFLAKFENVEFGINDNGEIFCVDQLNFKSRSIDGNSIC